MPQNAKFIFFFLSYLLGSVSVAYMIGKHLKKIDIREHGSGNAGTTNVFRVMGKRAAFITLLFDFAKGAIPVIVTSKYFGINMGLIAGVCAVIGHDWSIFMKFSGGKGVATSLGVMGAYDVRIALISLGCFILITYLVKRVSLASLLSSLISFVGIIFFHPDDKMAWVVFLLLGCLIIFRHKSNIGRIIDGTENKI